MGFRPDPGLAALLVVVSGLTWLAGRGRTRSRRHLVSLGGATACLAMAYLSPLETLARSYLLTAHLVQVTLVMAVAAPLLIVAVPPPNPPVSPRRHFGPLAVVAFPPAALVIVTVGFFAWHAAPAFNAALHTEPLYLAEQATYVLIAVIFWWPVLQPAQSRTAPAMSPVARLAYVLVATVPQTFGGITIALTPHVIYTAYGGGPTSAGLDPLTDQVIAGACIALLNKTALFAAAIVVFVNMMREEEEEDDDGGQRVSEPAAPLPGPIPTWVRKLESEPTVPEPAPRSRRQGAGTLRT